MPGWGAETTLGFFIAALIAGLVVLLDCYQIVSASTRSVPSHFYRSARVLGLAAACGGLAGAAFLIAKPGQADAISKLLSLDIANDFLRAVYVGAAVLVLIRSKVMQVQSAEIGGEFVYLRAREWALKDVKLRWIDWKDSFLNKNMGRAYGQADFAEKLIERIKAASDSGDGDYKATVLSQIQELQKAKPQGGFDASQREWQTYYQTVARLGLDTCGPATFYRMGFEKP